MAKINFLVQLIVKCTFLVIISSPVYASDDSELLIFDTGRPFDSYIQRLTVAIEAIGLTVTTGECKCGIKTVSAENFIGKDGAILTLNKPGLMLKMLQAGASAGANPPLRFYISRTDKGEARIAYHPPSLALGTYGQPNLDEIGKEFDVIFAQLIKETSGSQ